MQGGAFSPDGALLYLIHGYYKNVDEKRCGIKVFEVATARLVAQSTNGSGPFNYEFHTGATTQEPEGITVWDLVGRAPGIRGQLHAIMLENDVASNDDFYFKHYRVERRG